MKKHSFTLLHFTQLNFALLLNEITGFLVTVTLLYNITLIFIWFYFRYPVQSRKCILKFLKKAFVTSEIN